MFKNIKEETWVYSGIALYYAILLILAFALDGTGDEGDSEVHFTYLQHLGQHPEHFFHHWAKPVFVLLASPFATLSFVGLKIFNATVFVPTLFLTYRLAQFFKMPNAWFAPLILAFSKMTVVMALSSFTEPLFAFWLVVGIFLHTRERHIWAVIWLSFLPFVRSEGLVVFCVYIFYLLFKRFWRHIPLLAVGHLVYSIAGYAVHKNIFWAFMPTPYLNSGSIYGSGGLAYYALKMPEVVGIIIPFLLLLGFTEGGIRLFLDGKKLVSKSKTNTDWQFSKEELWLVYGVFTAFFIAHTLFWYLGMFNSCGLTRVFVGVLPLIALISLRGVNGIFSILKKNTARFKLKPMQILVASCLVFSLFESLKLSALQAFGIQKSMDYAADFVRRNYPNYADYTTYLESPHYAIALNLDYHNPKQKRGIHQIQSGEPIPTKSLVVWDDFFMPFLGVTLEKMQADKRFKFVKKFEERDKRFGNLRAVYLFEYDTLSAAHTDRNVLLATDFEKGTEGVGLDSTQAFSGKKSFLLALPIPYSTGFNGSLSSFPTNSKAAVIKLSSQIKLLDAAALQSTTIVFSFEHANAEIFEWRSIPLHSLLKAGSDWQKLTLIQSLRPPQYPTDRLKIYLWNASVNRLLLDDLRIELLP